MATNVATLTAKLTADTRQLKRGLGRASKDVDKFTKKTTRATGRVKQGFGGIAKVAAGLGLAFGAAVVVRGLNDAINAASNLEESVNAVQVVYGEAAEGVLALGANSVEQFGLSSRAVNDAAVGMGAFADKINAADPADAFKNIIQRATDFASVMNITTDEALDKFRAGLSGESEPLKKFGINVSEAAIKTFALNTGLIEVGDTMTEAQKIQARFGFIMQETAKTAGDFANTSDGLAGSQKKLSAAWEEAQVAIGEVLIPIMTDLVNLMIDIAKKVPGAIDTMSASVSAANRKWKIWNATWDDTQEAIFQVNLRMGDYQEKIATGSAESNVFAGALVDMQNEGDAYTNTIGELIKATDISNESLAFATIILLKGAEQYGLTAEQVIELETRQRELGIAMLAGVPIVENLTDGIDDLGDEFGEVSTKGRDALAALNKVKTTMREMADPVFRAVQATADYQDVLKEIQEDGRVTAEEFDTLRGAVNEMQAANEAVNSDNLDAYTTEASNLLRRLDDNVEVSAAIMEELPISAGAGFDATTRAFQRLIESPLRVEITATFPTDAAFERAVTGALSRAQRNKPGLFVITPTGF